jgi:hypothetical protein
MTTLEQFKPIPREEQLAFLERSYRSFRTTMGDAVVGNRDFESYSPEIVALIDEHIASGKYPFNRDIEALARERLFPHLPVPTKELLERMSQQCPYLSRIVYNSQQYRHARDEAEKLRVWQEKMTAEGFTQVTPELIQEAFSTQKKYIVAYPHNEPLRNMRAVLDGGVGPFWMASRNKVNGYRSLHGEFVKAQ